jgi:hypothetical protein
MNLSFSFTFNSSFPHIGRNGIGFGTPTRSFGYPSPSSFHNYMARPSLGLLKPLVGDTLYYIISRLTLSIKNRNKCIFVWLTMTFGSSFKYPLTQDLKLGISWMSCGMNGQFCKNMNAFIKSAMT